MTTHRIVPRPPPQEWYLQFGTRKFPYRAAGDFLVDWTTDRGTTRYISLAHFEADRERVLERLRAVACANGGGERRLAKGGATHLFYGTLPGGPARPASVRVDQQSIEDCSRKDFAPKLVTHGNFITTFQIGRSPQGRSFGLYCALAAMDPEMALAIDHRPARYRFGTFHVFGRPFSAVRVDDWNATLEYFTLQKTICLQFMEHYRRERFLERDTAAQIKTLMGLLVERAAGRERNAG